MNIYQKHTRRLKLEDEARKSAAMRHYTQYEMTTEEVAAVLGLSQRRVQQIETEAMRKIREGLV